MAGGSAKSPFAPDALRGRVALVTGGGSGIGFEIARQFGLHGCRVAIMGRRGAVLAAAAAKLSSEHGMEVLPLAGDVRQRDSAKACVEQVFAAFGRIDVLVNGAAGNFLASAEDLSPNAFRTVLDIDAVGTFNMCLAAREFLQRGGKGKRADEEGGVIINISATLHYTAMWYQVHLNAAKAAVDSTTRTLALEWGSDFGIRSNVVAPGPIAATPGMAKLAPDEAAVDAGEAVPLGRMGEAVDVAMAVVFLASDAGRYINGASIVVDGGGWLYRPRHISKQTVKAISRAVERRSRANQEGSREWTGATSAASTIKSKL